MVDLFNKLNQEEKQELKNFKLDKSLNIEKIIYYFEETTKKSSCIYSYSFWKELIVKKNLEYSAKDLRYLPLILTKDPKDYCYLPNFSSYLSALINKCNELNIIVNTSDIILDFLGINNEKNLTVIGDVGNYFCEFMGAGKVNLIGNAGIGFACNMFGGEISADGNVGDGCAESNGGGKIIINGDCGNFAARYMTGGTLVIKGNAGSDMGYYMKSGNIVVGENVLNNLGNNIKGGSILVKGNAGNRIGVDMFGAEITVLGNAGFEVGFGMIKDSKIYLGGDFISISGLPSGKWAYCVNCEIFHKGKLIFKDAKPINPDNFLYYKPYEMYFQK